MALSSVINQDKKQILSKKIHSSYPMGQGLAWRALLPWPEGNVGSQSLQLETYALFIAVYDQIGGQDPGNLS